MSFFEIFEKGAFCTDSIKIGALYELFVGQISKKNLTLIEEIINYKL